MEIPTSAPEANEEPKKSLLRRVLEIPPIDLEARPDAIGTLNQWLQKNGLSDRRSIYATEALWTYYATQVVPLVGQAPQIILSGDPKELFVCVDLVWPEPLDVTTSLEQSKRVNRISDIFTETMALVRPHPGINLGFVDPLTIVDMTPAMLHEALSTEHAKNEGEFISVLELPDYPKQ